MRIKASVLLLPFSITVCSCLIACSNGNISDQEDSKALPAYVSYDEIPESYSKEAAQADGCVVVESRSALFYLSYAK